MRPSNNSHRHLAICFHQLWAPNMCYRNATFVLKIWKSLCSLFIWHGCHKFNDCWHVVVGNCWHLVLGLHFNEIGSDINTSVAYKCQVWLMTTCTCSCMTLFSISMCFMVYVYFRSIGCQYQMEKQILLWLSDGLFKTCLGQSKVLNSLRHLQYFVYM